MYLHRWIQQESYGWCCRTLQVGNNEKIRVCGGYKALSKRLSWRIQNLQCTNEGTNNVLRLNQATCKVQLFFSEAKLPKLMCIQQFLMLLNEQECS